MTDRDPRSVAERTIGLIIRISMSISAGFMLAGLIAHGVNEHGPVQGVPDGMADILLYAGVAILLLTPLARVLVAAIHFLARKEWRFAAMAAAVLVVLVVELIVALRS